MRFSRNLSPMQLAVITALVISPAGGLLHFYYTKNIFSSLIIFLGLMALTTWITYALFQSLIQKQIRLIYKLIMQTRTSRKESFYYNNLLPPKTVEEVKNDVEQWAKQHNQEIEILQKNELYRKEFLQNLSHELKTPVFSIQGYLDTLLNGALEKPEINRNFLKNASRNVDRLVNLLDDLDQITRLEMGELKLQTENFLLQELILEVFESFSLRCEEALIRCNIRKDCDKNIQVYADREKIRQVFTNIIDNAIKYGKLNGNIEASFHRLDKNTALIEVRDDGEGISEEHRQRIFERFYRTNQARDRKVGGSGLGLAICKHIIEAHQQTIYVRSTPQVGSTFCFSLPLKK